VNVNQYDILLDVLIVNQTSDTLQNCTLELATLGDLKLVEKPSPFVLGPLDFCTIKANVKVTPLARRPWLPNLINRALS
jgi:coatomer subunit beta